jgi:hypothetical protein
MTAPVFIYTSEPWAALSFGRPIFGPSIHAAAMAAQNKGPAGLGGGAKYFGVAERSEGRAPPQRGQSAA